MRRRTDVFRPKVCGVLLSVALTSNASITNAATNCESPKRIAEGVFLVSAKEAVATPQNGGRTRNSVFLIGPLGITIVDPGPTFRAGKSLRCSIKKVSGQPVVALINTHPHAQQVLANGAFPGTPIYASARTAETMRLRCPTCMQNLEKQIGTANMLGTLARIPDQLIAFESEISPGGRALQVLPMGDAHSRGDLAVLDLATKTLISGDLGNVSDLPELRDGNIDGWIVALKNLLGRGDIRIVIPGYGQPTIPSSLHLPLDYLQSLRQFTEGEIRKGEMLAPNKVPKTLRRYGGSETTQLLNLQHAMREAENRWWSDKPNTAPDLDPKAGQNTKPSAATIPPSGTVKSPAEQHSK